MAIASVSMLVSTIRLVQETSHSFRYSLSFYAAQIEYDTSQLIDHLDRFAHRDPKVGLDDVTMRFDILWSRVNISNPPDTSESEPLGLPMARQTLTHTLTILTEIEPAILSLRQDDLASIQSLKDKLRTVVPLAHRLVLAAKDNTVSRNADFLGAQLRQAYYTVFLIAGMVLFGVMSILMLRSDRRQIRSMNAQLETRVQVRTEALVIVNARLAAEIAERKAEQLIASQREERLAQAVKLSKLGYYIWDVITDTCEFCSDQHARVHGLTPEEFIQKTSTLDGSSDLTHPDDRERVRLKCKELRNGSPVEIDYRVLTQNGVRRVREIARPVLDETGKVIKEIGSTLDVTELYEAELKLAEAQRMDSIGKLTGGIAHDFNNLMAVILGNLELLKEVPDSEDRSEMIEDAINATLRGRDLTLNMLSFARRAPLDPTRLNLNVVISDIQVLLRRTLPQNISLNIDLADESWDIMADRSLTESALLNLVINARDAMESGGDLMIRTRNMILGPDYLHTRGEEIEPGNYVMLSVTDTGSGIDPETEAKIFDPFFTTKPVGKNSGLGLSMVQGFIKQTGGALEVRSRPGVGTTFLLFFRSASAADNPVCAASIEDVGDHRRALRLLLIEDDLSVQKTLTRQLQHAGMTVVGAAESSSAMDAFKNDGPFDLVVSDIVMPGLLQGPDLVQQLRVMQSDLPAIFLSGYPKGASVHSAELGIDEVLLMKPVSRSALLQAIDVVLGDKASDLHKPLSQQIAETARE